MKQGWCTRILGNKSNGIFLIKGFFNPITKIYATLDLAKPYQANEKLKRRRSTMIECLQVEHGSFTLLVISACW